MGEGGGEGGHGPIPLPFIPSPAFAEAATRRQAPREGTVLFEKGIMVKECKIETIRIRKRKSPSLKKQRKGVSPVEPAFGKKEAVQEARRCLGWKECESCEICTLFCPDFCITRDGETGRVLIDLNYCKGCGICASVCPKGAIQMMLEEEGA
jgi:2-oxoacid:acceptor oxidoreductase delta subunit (pyruvate/2-ketoisovalerate family)